MKNLIGTHTNLCTKSFFSSVKRSESVIKQVIPGLRRQPWLLQFLSFYLLVFGCVFLLLWFSTSRQTSSMWIDRGRSVLFYEFQGKTKIKTQKKYFFRSPFIEFHINPHVSVPVLNTQAFTHFIFFFRLFCCCCMSIVFILLSSSLSSFDSMEFKMIMIICAQNQFLRVRMLISNTNKYLKAWVNKIRVVCQTKVKWSGDNEIRTFGQRRKKERKKKLPNNNWRLWTHFRVFKFTVLLFFFAITLMLNTSHCLWCDAFAFHSARVPLTLQWLRRTKEFLLLHLKKRKRQFN